MAIYLDHAATTPLRPEALEAMLPFLTSDFGHASSAHGFGRRSGAGKAGCEQAAATATIAARPQAMRPYRTRVSCMDQSTD